MSALPYLSLLLGSFAKPCHFVAPDVSSSPSIPPLVSNGIASFNRGELSLAFSCAFLLVGRCPDGGISVKAGWKRRTSMSEEEGAPLRLSNSVSHIR
jgi:hypothetical protein